MRFTTKDLLQDFHPTWLPDGVSAAMLRLDRLHPLVQGNKWFKLKRNLEAAGRGPVVTFGGPWSNHLHAAASACRLLGVPVTGIVRGEAPPSPPRTLTEAAALGMAIVHVPRALYDLIKKGGFPASGTGVSGRSGMEAQLRALLEAAYVIPEGGGNAEGAAGCEEILDLGDFRPFTHLLCATGTGTTLAGLINGAAARGLGMEIWGISALKGAFSVEADVRALLKEDRGNWGILHDFHEGGFAKVTDGLIDEMNDFYRQTGIPTDRVYTAKLVRAFRKMAAAGRFPPNSRIALIHTGGLQGNASLPPGTLHF